MKTSFKIFIAKYLSKILIYTLSNSPTITKRKKINWKLDLNEAIDLSIFLFGSFEPSIQKIVKNILKNETKNIDIIDIGANCGSHTLNFANEHKFSRIFAIEPTKYGYDKLIENIELNPDLKTSIIIKPPNNPKIIPKISFDKIFFLRNDIMSNVNKGFNVVTNMAPLPAWPKYVPLKKAIL